MDDESGLLRKLDRIRRFLLTVVLYLIFAIGSLAVSLLLVFPAAVISRDQARRVKRVRQINRLAFKIFTRLGIVLGVFNVSFIDAWRLDLPGQLIIANHPSLLDVVFLLGRIPNANCVVKKKLLKNPFLAIQVYFADYIPNDDKKELLQNCVVSLERGESLIIFPEGTRTVKGQHYKFKRGAAHLMLMSNCPVRLVYISCHPSVLDKKTPWYMIPERKITYRFTVMAELDIMPIKQASHLGIPLKSRRLTMWLMRWYEAMDLGNVHRSFEKITLPSIPDKSSVS